MYVRGDFFLIGCWRIPYVEKVVNDPTQLFRVGFPTNFYVDIVLYGVLYLCGTSRSGMRFWRIPYVENVIWGTTQLFGVGFPVNFYVEFILSGCYGFGTVWQRHISV